MRYIEINLFNGFPEPFISISALYTLGVLVLITYNVYGSTVQKSFNQCISLTLLLVCYLFFNGMKFQFILSLGFYNLSTIDYFFFVIFIICSFFVFYFLVVADFLKEHMLISFKFSAVLRVVQKCGSEIHLFLLQHSSKISVLIRPIWTILVILFYSPEYAYCMDLDPSNTVVQYTTPHWPGFSEAQLKLGQIKTNLEFFLKVINEDTGDLSGPREIFKGASDQIKNVQIDVEKTKESFYTSVGDLSDKLDFLEVVLDKHGSRIRAHDKTLNGDSELREVVDDIKWKSSTALGILGATLAGIAVVLLKASKS